jgi:nicotinamidase-related amidase
MTHTHDALICIDFINEIVGETGKLTAKGYGDFIRRHDTLANLRQLQDQVRSSGGRVIFVNLGFSSDYADWPKSSPLLGGAKGGGILQFGTSSTEVHETVAPQARDIVLTKKRISAFHDTGLDTLLRTLGAKAITLAGVSTDLAVESAARDAHDLDYSVQIAGDCCGSMSDSDHESALRTMAKFATVI